MKATFSKHCSPALRVLNLLCHTWKRRL